MKLDVHNANTGAEAIVLLEDLNPSLLVVDVKLPDMHAWQLLGRMKEIHRLRALPIVVIMDEPQVVPLGSVETVIRPVSMARLRHIVWSRLKNSPDGS